MFRPTTFATVLLAALAILPAAERSYALRLDNAVGEGLEMFFDLEMGPYGWQRLWPQTPRFNKGFHEGVVAASEVSDAAITFDLVVDVKSDPWIKGGWGRYAVTLTPGDDGLWRGTWTGRFQDAEREGAAELRVLPGGTAPQERPPVPLDEHPRLLFRRDDLPALREKAATDFGKAALAKMDGPIGLAVRYQLTGDKALAEEAIPLVEALMADVSNGDKRVKSRVHGWRMEQVAIAYDCCFDAWSEAFKARVRRYVLAEGWRTYNDLASYHPGIPWNHRSQYCGPIRYGAALGTLAILGVEGPAPVPPAAPQDAALAAGPPAGYVPGDGVVAGPFTDDVLPQEWIVATGFEHVPDEDLLAAVGGLKTFPSAGTEVTAGGTTASFKALGKDKKSGHHGRMLDVAAASGRTWHSTLPALCVIDNDRDRLVQVRLDTGDVAWLGTTRVRDGSIVRLAAGKVPFLVFFRVGLTNDWGCLFKRPRLAAVDADFERGWYAKVAREHGYRTRMYEHDLAVWEASGKQDPATLQFADLNRGWMATFCRRTMGRGGFEMSTPNALLGPGRYLSAYRTMYGRDLTPEEDAEAYLARQMLTAFPGEDGNWYQDMRDHRGMVGEEYAGTFDFTPQICTALFGAAKPAWRPAVLWGWQRMLGLTGHAEAAKALDEDFHMPGYPHAAHAAWTFVAYPLDLAPQDPAGILPLTWRCEDHRWFAWRSAWDDPDACLLQVNGGLEDLGTGGFRLAGLGERWILGKGSRRDYDTVVQVPGLDLADRGRAAAFRRAKAGVVDHRAGADGSGGVTLDLDPVYGAAAEGLGGSRSFAVDYSGACGAPALVAVVDHVTGAGEGAYWWCPFIEGGWKVGGWLELKKIKDPAKRRARNDELWETELPKFKAKNKRFLEYAAARDQVLAGLSCEGNRFTIAKGARVLTAHVFSDAPVTTAVDEVEQRRMAAKCSALWSVCTGIAARGGRDYLVVITLSPKDAVPTVTVEGEGLAAVVTVGGRTVRVVDGKAVIE